MTTFLIVTILILLVIAIALWMVVKHLRSQLKDERAVGSVLREQFRQETEQMREAFREEAEKVQADYSGRVSELEAERERIRLECESHARTICEPVIKEVEAARSRLAELSRYEGVADAETTALQRVQAAIEKAEALEAEAEKIIAAAQAQVDSKRIEAETQANVIIAEAGALLAQARTDATSIRERAEAAARQLSTEVYEALNRKDELERASKAILNVIGGYGDRYVVPTHSLIDELASDFGHLAAGESLRLAREQSKRMVETGEAATCDYAEQGRRQTAIRFVTDAFNGKVDAVLSRIRYDNAGTLEQEIRDAFEVVNLNGEAFRSARVKEEYLSARLEELRWGAVVLELKRKEREEQRRLQEQIREEERARREYERALQEAAREEAAIKKALEKARDEVAHASEQEKQRYLAKMEELERRLQEAESKGQRALSMAQQTRSGNVYVISNIGAFGEDVVKIGMTRRLEPYDRIKELGDASVPFEFDVHAMIRSDDAPALERELHIRFDDYRINKVNYRKEFFRVPVSKLREFVGEKGLEATFTMVAEAREFRESQALQRMTPEERARIHQPREGADASDD